MLSPAVAEMMNELLISLDELTGIFYLKKYSKVFLEKINNI